MHRNYVHHAARERGIRHAPDDVGAQGLLGNIQVRDGDATDSVAVRSNLLLCHTRWDRPEYTVLTAERQYVLRHDGARWLLAGRVAVPDNTVIPALNMSFFF